MAFVVYASFKGKNQGQLKAESKKEGRKDKWCEVLTYDMQSEVPIDVKSAGAKGACTFFPLRIVKEIGAATPQLLDAHYKAERFDQVILEIVGRPETGVKEVTVQRITLTDALISSFRQYSPQLSTDHVSTTTDHIDEIKLVSRKIEVENIAGQTSTSFDLTKDQ
jgi:type VI secretion system Hcp family effector